MTPPVPLQDAKNFDYVAKINRLSCLESESR